MVVLEPRERLGLGLGPRIRPDDRRTDGLVLLVDEPHVVGLVGVGLGGDGRHVLLVGQHDVVEDLQAELAELDGAPFDATATIRFPEEGRIAGEGPCNLYSAAQGAPYPWFAPGPIAGPFEAVKDTLAPLFAGRTPDLEDKMRPGA